MKPVIKILDKACFRATVILSLIILGSLFSLRLDIDESHLKEKQSPAKYHSIEKVAEQEQTTFGLGAEGWTAVFTGGLLVFTMALAAFTYRLFRVTKDGLLEQAKLTRKALGHAETSANAAKASADALVAAERAHIRIQQVKIDPANLFSFDLAKESEKKMTMIKLSWIFENYGKTPADIDDCMVNLWAGKYEKMPLLPMREMFQQTIPAGEKSGVNHFASEVLAERSIRNELIRKTDFIRAEIIVFYYDIFGTRQVEHVRWRYDNFGGGERFAMIEREEPLAPEGAPSSI